MSTSGCPGATSMEAMDFERSSISWTLKGDAINGSWRIIATACRQDSADCIYLAPAVMAGKIFGTDRLPIEPPFSYQLIATGGAAGALVPRPVVQAGIG